MGQMQRRKRIMRELRGMSKPRGRVWPTVEAFEADACSYHPPLTTKAFAEALAGCGLVVYFDHTSDLVRAIAV